jgi:hypothetical protein
MGTDTSDPLGISIDWTPIPSVTAGGSLHPPGHHPSGILANTQRELRRAIHHLAQRRAAELGINNAFDHPLITSVPQGCPRRYRGKMDPSNLAPHAP